MSLRVRAMTCALVLASLPGCMLLNPEDTDDGTTDSGSLRDVATGRRAGRPGSRRATPGTRGGGSVAGPLPLGKCAAAIIRTRRGPRACGRIQVGSTIVACMDPGKKDFYQIDDAARWSRRLYRTHSTTWARTCASRGWRDPHRQQRERRQRIHRAAKSSALLTGPGPCIPTRLSLLALCLLHFGRGESVYDRAALHAVRGPVRAQQSLDDPAPIALNTPSRRSTPAVTRTKTSATTRTTTSTRSSSRPARCASTSLTRLQSPRQHRHLQRAAGPGRERSVRQPAAPT